MSFSNFSLETLYKLIKAKSRKCFHYFRKPYLDRGLTPRDFVFSMAMPTSKYTRAKLVSDGDSYIVLVHKSKHYIIGYDDDTGLPFCRYVGHHFINLNEVTVRDVKKMLGYELELDELSDVKEGSVVRVQGDLLMEVYKLFNSTEEVLECLIELYATVEFYNDLARILNAYVESCISKCRATHIYYSLLLAFEKLASDDEYRKLSDEFDRTARGLFYCHTPQDYLRVIERVIEFFKKLKGFSYDNEDVKYANRGIKYAIKLASYNKSKFVEELRQFCDRWNITKAVKDLPHLIEPSYVSLDVIWNRLFSEFRSKYNLESIGNFINVSDFLNKVIDSECILRIRVGNHLINLIAIELIDIISPIRYSWSVSQVQVPLDSLVVLRSQVVKIEHPEHRTVEYPITPSIISFRTI